MRPRVFVGAQSQQVNGAEDMIRDEIRRERDALFVQAYHRLKRIGRRSRGYSDGDTWCTTALVHELYLQLARQQALAFRDERGFYAYAAQAIRHFLVDAARRRARLRAGGDAAHVALDASLDEVPVAETENILMLDQALQRLEAVDARAAEVVKLHYFVGLSIEQVARSYGVCSRTIDRDWRFAKAFLERALTG